jgi:hypothetical protein
VAPDYSDGPRGIGGWLVLPLLGLALTPIVIGVSLVTDYLPIFRDEWAVITDEAYEAYHPLWGPLVVYEVMGSVAIALASWLALVLAFRHDRRFPKLAIAIYAANLVYLALDTAVAAQISALATSDDPTTVRELGRAFVAAAIWIPYFLRSRRVRNTFVR